MVRQCSFTLGLVVLWAATGMADVTLRQSVTLNFSSLFPEAVRSAMQESVKSTLPSGTVLQIKNGRAVSSSATLTIMMEADGNRITLLNPKSKQYADTTYSEYLDATRGALKSVAPPAQAQQAFQNLHHDVQTKKTGQFAMIQGVRAEESLIVATMQMPSPAGTMRMEMHYWIALPDDIRRVPALKELADYAEQSRRKLDAANLVGSFTPMPGMTELMGAIRDLMKDNIGWPLKSSTKMYAPAMVQALQKAPQPGQSLDPNAPMMEILMDVAELSTNPVPDSVFSVPADYQAAPVEELVKALMPVQSRPPAGAPAPSH